ncbi:MAG: peptidase domain-containing ABC transporter [Bacillota bacterium]
MLEQLLKNYVCIRQHDTTDCGAACLASISQYYGLKISITQIRQMAGTDTQGTNAYGLVRAAKNLGFTAKGVKAAKEDLMSEFKLPAIANIVNDDMLFHFVVVYSIKKDGIIAADPDKGIVKYTLDKFVSMWTGGLILLEPGEGFKKGNHTKGIFRFLGLLKPLKATLVYIFLASMLYTVLGLLGSFYIKYLFDDLIKFNKLNNLHTVSMGFAAIFLLQILLNFYRSFLITRLSIKIDKSIMMEYYLHVLKLPMSFFSSRKTGEIISRFLDASRIREAISGATLTIMIDTIMAAAGGIILYMQNRSLFLITVGIVILYGIIVVSFNRPIKKANRIIMEDNAQLTSNLVESIKGIETVKAFNSETKTRVNTEKKLDKLMASTFKGSLIRISLSSLTGLTAGLGGILILWVGTYNIMEGRMSPGQLLAFNALLVYFLVPIRNLIDLQPLIQTAVVASSRLGEILDLEIEKNYSKENKVHLTSLKGDIEFKNVDFRYGARQLVLRNISLVIPEGKKVALVGESGSGKTTLAKLLMNFYSPENGEISIADHNINDINLDFLRRKIAFISQDIFIFSGTVKENICFGLDSVDMEEIINASKMAKAHDFIEDLPFKYDTFLQENGVNLSEGQKQRIAIARAILKKPDIIIMDEATSNLDTVTESHIKDTINHIGSGMTVIIIAHRLNTVMNCDEIFVMEKGKIVEHGTHEELVELGGYYNSMWQQYHLKAFI